MTINQISLTTKGGGIEPEVDLGEAVKSDNEAKAISNDF